MNDLISRQDVLKILSSKNAALDAYDKVKQLPSVQPVNYGSTKSDSSSQLKLNNDLISRKQVLNASHFVACWDGVEHFSLEVVDADFIQKLPSVQPTQSNADSTHENTLDCVSRRAAMIVIENSGLDDDSKDTVVRVLEQLPSAQPERKKGKWIKVGDCSWKCNDCNEISCCSANFCPDCGADMRGEDDE